MKLYSYVVKYDYGFAPNPFWGYCTLACCKPGIRKFATIGDWVVGTGSVKNIGNDKLIYAMKITEKLTFEQYSRDRRFLCKIPKVGKIESKGDNIYYKLKRNGIYVQRESYYHRKEEMDRDLKADAVLISDEFSYFGKDGVVIPEHLKHMIKKGPKYKYKFTSESVSDFINWLEGRKFPKGKYGEPSNIKNGRCSGISCSSHRKTRRGSCKK